MAGRDHRRPGLRSGKSPLAPVLLGAALLALVPGTAPARAEQGGAVAPRLPGDGKRASSVPPLTGEFAARPELRPGIEFWKGIFGLYSSDQAVVHHAHSLDIIYSVLDFSDLAGNPRADRIRRSRTQAEVNRVQAKLRRMHQAGSSSGFSEKDRRIYDQVRKARGGFSTAMLEENIHVQSGISDKFRAGLITSRRYLPEIEAIFMEEGLPQQLTRMPFVESTFNVKAHSKAGASGIWQFIPSTGRLYLNISNAVDERRDPILASRAAAKLLKHNYSVSRRWPLAVTAYNHGLGGVMRAVRATGSSDIADIIRNYRGSRFGYASRNFFVELLAALEVERDYERYFGPLAFPPPFSYDEIRINRSLQARHLLQSGISENELAEMNPGLSDRTLRNYYSIPPGTLIRAPLGRGESVVARLNELRDSELPSYVASGSSRHRVRSGETLSGVARRYGVSRHALARSNGISSNAHLRIGQVLKVPGSRRRATRVASSGSGRKAVFVRRADHGRSYRGIDPGSAAPTRLASSPAPTRLASGPAPFDATAIALGASKSTAGDRDKPRERREPPSQSPPAAPPSKGTVPPALSETPDGNRPGGATVPEPEPPAPAAAPVAPVAAPAAPDKPIASPGAVMGGRAAAPSAGGAREQDSVAPAPPPEAVPEEAPSVTHVVRRNETLWLIAKKYGTSVSKIRAANRGRRLEPLLPGTRLVIGGAEAVPEEAPSVTHVVRRNETLWLIAKKYGTSVSKIRAANRGKKLKPLLPGTRIAVPGSAKTHVVRRNETLWGIAKRYQISLAELKAANSGKPLSPLKPGIELLIPG